MTIDIDELRQLVQAATPGPWVATTVATSIGVCHKVGPFPGKTTEHPPRHACLYVDYESADNPADREIYANASFIAAANPATISVLLDRLEAAEKERDALRAEVETTENDAAHQKALADSALRVAEGWERKCGELRAKIAEMEQQEPVAWMQSTHLSSFKNRLCGSQSSYVHCSDHQLHPDFKPLYALPGAQEQEPTRDWWDCLIADISAIDCMYRGSPTYAHDAYWMREHVVRMLEQRRDALPGAKGE